MFKRLITIAAIAVIIAGAGVHTTQAQKAEFGLRAGFGIDPDQFVVGGHAVFGRYLKVFRFAPSVDLGFGDNMTVFNANGDFRFSLTPPGSATKFYLGGGPTLSHYEFDAGSGDTEVGISAIGGIGIPMSSVGTYGIEARVGFGDIPDFRALLTLTFGGSRAKETDDDPDIIIQNEE